MDESQIDWRVSKGRSLRLAVTSSGVIRVFLPRFISKQTALRFMEEKRMWIERAKARLGKKEELPSASGVLGKRERAQAKKRILERIAYFNREGRFTIRGISIRDQRTRWGSCSSTGKLSFQYRLIRLPLPLLDYVVVHELCHLEHLNHSHSFWRAVESILPDYVRLQAELKQYRLEEA
ncbi:M48 family metallopeptidase [Patescibacteria group bacterium]|nr:M48 family metallopeptidase [Patescibacteria group bacterium]